MHILTKDIRQSKSKTSQSIITNSWLTNIWSEKRERKSAASIVRNGYDMAQIHTQT